MYLLRILDLLALCGLFVQAFAAWVFVAVLASIRDRDSERGAIRTFVWAFVALSLALTVMSVRFFRAHDVSASYVRWADGLWAPTVCYSLYMGMKAWFVWLLVLGSHRLSGRPEPRWLRPALPPLVVSMAMAPLAIPGIDALLLFQAPVVVAGSLLSARALREARARVRLVHGALIGLAVTWTIHATAILAGSSGEANPLLSLNSFIDLGVQLLLGIGLVVCLLEDSHRRRIEAEQEREGLRQSIERDEKLRALGTVVSGVAHELNNPLTVILGHADILRRQVAGHRPATIIKEQAERCRGIVRNLSALAGQSVHPREEVDLEALVRRVVAGLPERVTHEGRHVVQRVAGGLRGSVDRIGIDQVGEHLLDADAVDAPAQAARHPLDDVPPLVRHALGEAGDDPPDQSLE
ncbi:MAG: histidine kinase dimerization/phospho-acceptor domain-containing protein, partial [Planctomycetota bacterium JB042]